MIPRYKIIIFQQTDPLPEHINDSPLYFTRTRGLFRECFLGEKNDDPDKTSAPLGSLVELYMSPVETWCRNLDYYIPDEENVTKTFNQEQMTRIRKWKLSANSFTKM